MLEYPFTPEILDALPEPLVEQYRALEMKLLKYICECLKDRGEPNETVLQNIRALRSHGISLDEIEKVIAKTTLLSLQEIDKMFDAIVEANQQYYTELIELADVTKPTTLINELEVEMIRQQTKDEFTNITQSMGFYVRQGGEMVLQGFGKAYQWALDQAEIQVESGTTSYSTAIENAIKQLADSGIKTVNYESEHVDQIDVAVRRATLTGVNQLNAKYRDNSMDFLNTDLVEVSAHAGARDKDGVNVWDNHKNWQGKVYRWKEKPRTSKGEYPDFEEKCGYGSVTGILGANCRHSFFPFVEGVSTRTYTDEELANIDNPPFEFDGKTYTTYEATQMQRKIERTVRKLKREREGFKSQGNTDKARDVNIRIRRLTRKYNDFSEAAGLRTQEERMKVLY
jgi:DNA-binding transcriptional MerR regulator